MKLSKILGYFAQFVNFLYKAITGSESNIISAVTTANEKLQEVVTAESGKVVSAVIASAAAQVELTNSQNALANERQQILVERLDRISYEESEDEIRKAIEPYLPEELANTFNY